MLRPNIDIPFTNRLKLYFYRKNKLERGVVIKSTGSWYRVRRDDQSSVNCRIRGSFRLRGSQVTNPVVVGDQVEFILQEGEETGIITRILERKNYIIRRSSRLSREAQILAANIDLAILVATLVEPPTSTIFIDRFLVSAEAYRIPVLLLFNKTDLYGEKEWKVLGELEELYTGIGYDFIACSAVSQGNLAGLARKIEGKVCIISGHSGVGKSTLINALDPKIAARIGEISDYHKKGKHTTTYPEMYRLESGGYIIDTPGIKGFGVVDMDREEVFHFFPEIFSCSHHCQFHNCLHLHEPKCAVRKAVSEGRISTSRYRSYLSIMEQDDSKYRM